MARTGLMYNANAPSSQPWHALIMILYSKSSSMHEYSNDESTETFLFYGRSDHSAHLFSFLSPYPSSRFISAKRRCGLANGKPGDGEVWCDGKLPCRFFFYLFSIFVIKNFLPPAYLLFKFFILFRKTFSFKFFLLNFFYLSKIFLNFY